MTDDVLFTEYPAHAGANYTNKPDAVIRDGRLPELIDRVEQYLIKAGAPVYQRDGRLVKVGWHRFPKRNPFLGIETIHPLNLAETLTRLIVWKKYDARRKAHTICDCPRSVAETYLARSGQWLVPTIRSVITAPTLREDGSVLNQPGFDVETGVYFDPLDVEFPPIPDAPTRADARTALDRLIAVVSEVPFVCEDDGSPVSRSVFLSGLLSGLIRTALPAAPLHGFDAPGAGSGKSMLVDAITIAMTGEPACVLAQGHTDEETEKRLATVLCAGDSVVSFDNCNRPIEGDLLCQAVTQPFLSLRILGRTERVRVANTAMYFATGNNLTVTGDMVRRTLRCRIDAACERPEDRAFQTERPDKLVRADRGNIVAAGLTVLRAYFIARQPQQSTPLGSLETWSRTVRDALIWLGEPDPCRSIEKARAEDPEREKVATVLREWYGLIGDNEQQPFTWACSQSRGRFRGS